MGLTGVILSASIRLMRVDSLDIDERVTPFRDLGEFFDLIERSRRRATNMSSPGSINWRPASVPAAAC